METTTPILHALSRNIKDAREIADNLDFPLILDCGSLLGAYRDGGPIKKDEDDVDFAVPERVARMLYLDLINAFLARGFKLYRLRDTMVCFERDGSKIDILFYKKGDGWNMGYYLTLYFNGKRYALATEAKAYDELGEIEFAGTTFQCPKDIEAHLKHRYGDWKTPILRPAFTFQNYIDRGVMILL